jgi:[acyl-carrier-protein] S-malonyltransferase
MIEAETTTCIMFPGQGTQKIGMGMDFYDAFSEVRDLFSTAADYFGIDFLSLLKNGPSQLLSETINAQPIITILNVALYTLIARRIVPNYIAGHSLGELSAVYAAECISREQLFLIVKKRSEFMAQAARASNGTMIAIENIAVDTIRTLIERCGTAVNIANDNTPTQVVISGDKKILADFLTSSKSDLRGTRSLPLNVSGAWHSHLMGEAAVEFGKVVAPLKFKSPKIPIFMNVSGERCDDPDLIKQYLADQLTHPVCWTKTMHNLLSLGANRFITAGFGKVLKGLFLGNARQHPNCRSFAIETVADFERIVTSVE